MSRFFAENFPPQSAEKFCRGTCLCCRIFRVSKNSMHKSGISQISIEKMLSHSTEDFREGILCFWRNSGFEKFYGWKGGITFFRRKILVPQCRLISWASLHCFKKIGVWKNFMNQRGRGVSRFSVENFSHTVPRSFVGEHFGVSENFCVSQEFMHRMGISLNSVEKVLSHSADKDRSRTLLFLERFLISKSFKQRRG